MEFDIIGSLALVSSLVQIYYSRIAYKLGKENKNWLIKSKQELSSIYNLLTPSQQDKLSKSMKQHTTEFNNNLTKSIDRLHNTTHK